MTPSAARQAVKNYGKVGALSAVEAASPHRLIQMLFEGALARIASAKGHIRRGEIARKGECIGIAISIVETLRASLDHGGGEPIVANLDALYEYSVRRLLLANLHGDETILDEVAALLGEVKQGWDAIAPQPAPRPVDGPLRVAGSAA